MVLITSTTGVIRFSGLGELHEPLSFGPYQYCWTLWKVPCSAEEGVALEGCSLYKALLILQKINLIERSCVKSGEYVHIDGCEGS